MTGKKNNTIKQTKAYRPWLILLFIGPAIFLLLYWFTMRSGVPPEVHMQALPTEFLQPGDEAMVENKSYRAEDIRTSKELRFANNTVMADTGFIFAVIPIRVPDGYDLDLNQWWLLDNEKTKYNLLKVTNENPITDRNQATVQSEANVKYAIFKIKRETGECYLVFKDAAWRYDINKRPNSYG